jgi:hypothetical protein
VMGNVRPGRLTTMEERMHISINDLPVEGLKQMDVTAPRHVEIAVREDRKTIWINVDGICVLRCCRIDHLTIDDKRSESGATPEL